MDKYSEHKLDVSGLEGHPLAKYFSPHDLLQEFVDLIVRKTGSSIGYLHFYDEASEELDLKIWSGTALLYGPVTHDMHYHAEPSEIWTKSILKRAPDLDNASRKTCLIRKTTTIDFEVTNYISLPIFMDEKIVAVLGVGNREKPYEAADLEQLEVYVKVGWPVIMDRLRKSAEDDILRGKEFFDQTHEVILVSMTQAIGKALELRDEYTSHHQENVALITSRIAARLGLSDERCFGLNIGSFIHDIGKIAVPAETLNKTGRLLPPEYEMLKLHTSYGRKIFEHLKLPWPIADMIGQHHERMDGSGYPDGVKGSSICLEARIIAVADTYDAMSGDRPYRRAPGQEAAISTLIDDRITKFDPYVVDAFMEVLDGSDEVKRLYA
ncbi:MAG: HD domain-containing phosphohydrolase [Rhodospirillales bacterium]